MAEPAPCTYADESICEDCNLDDDLNCRYDEKLVSCFRSRHIPFRALTFVVVGVASWLTGAYWMILLFTIVTLLNFTVIETWYLCRHCPFYSKDGMTLHCITLKGIPRPWKYSPAPASKSEQYAMMTVGGFIDLFPLAAGAYAAWVLYTTGAELLVLSTMIGLTVLMLIVSGYLGKFLADNYCVRCVNLSCTMNKVPKEVAEEYLRRNPAIMEIWKACGYGIDEENSLNSAEKD